MQISTLSNLKLDDAKEFEILDPLTGKRSQTYNPKTETWVKRDSDNGRFIDVKKDGTPFKGVRKEK